MLSSCAQGKSNEANVQPSMLYERRFVPNMAEFPFRHTLDKCDEIPMLVAYHADHDRSTFSESFSQEHGYLYQERKTGHPWREVSPIAFAFGVQSAQYTLRKTRYVIQLEEIPVYVDVYEGKLKGYCQVRMVFPNRETAYAYDPPSWFGPEVTHLSELHSGFSLARKVASKQ